MHFSHHLYEILKIIWCMYNHQSSTKGVSLQYICDFSLNKYYSYQLATSDMNGSSPSTCSTQISVG